VRDGPWPAMSGEELTLHRQTWLPTHPAWIGAVSAVVPSAPVIAIVAVARITAGRDLGKNRSKTDRPADQLQTRKIPTVITARQPHCRRPPRRKGRPPDGSSDRDASAATARIRPQSHLRS